MTVTVDQLAEYVGADPAEPLLPGLLEAATAQIDEELKPSGKRKCPTSVYDLAVLQLSSEHWVRRNSPGGVVSWGPDGSVPARLAADAMISVDPLIRKYKPLGATR